MILEIAPWIGCIGLASGCFVERSAANKWRGWFEDERSKTTAYIAKAVYLQTKVLDYKQEAEVAEEAHFKAEVRLQRLLEQRSQSTAKGNRTRKAKRDALKAETGARLRDGVNEGKAS